MERAPYIILKDIVIFCSVLFYILAINSAGFSQEQWTNEISSEIKRAAIEGLPEFAGKEAKFVSEPFRIYTIYREKLARYDGKVSVLEMISGLPIWCFPVYSSKNSLQIMMVSLLDGKWRAVSIGAARIASKWDSIIKEYPSSKGYEHIFVRVYQAATDFVILKQNNNVELLSLVEYKKYDPKSLLLKLKNSVIEDIKKEKTGSELFLK